MLPYWTDRKEDMADQIIGADFQKFRSAVWFDHKQVHQPSLG
jgi:hypothetical protein